MKISSNFLMLWAIGIYLCLNQSNPTQAQTFNADLYFNNPAALDSFHVQHNRTWINFIDKRRQLKGGDQFLEALYESGYLGKSGQNYFLTLPYSEIYKRGTKFKQVKHLNLWFRNGWSIFGYDQNDNPIDPIEQKYIEVFFKKKLKVQIKKFKFSNPGGNADLYNSHGKRKGAYLSRKDRKLNL